MIYFRERKGEVRPAWILLGVFVIGALFFFSYFNIACEGAAEKFLRVFVIADEEGCTVAVSLIGKGRLSDYFLYDGFEDDYTSGGRYCKSREFEGEFKWFHFYDLDKKRPIVMDGKARQFTVPLKQLGPDQRFTIYEGEDATLILRVVKV